MIARCMPRLKPCAASPQASARTSSATWRQVQVCQMPRSFSRVAGCSAAPARGAAAAAETCQLPRSDRPSAFLLQLTAPAALVAAAVRVVCCRPLTAGDVHHSIAVAGMPCRRAAMPPHVDARADCSARARPSCRPRRQLTRRCPLPMPTLADLLAASPWARALPPARPRARRGRDRQRMCRPAATSAARASRSRPGSASSTAWSRWPTCPPRASRRASPACRTGGWFGEGSLLKDEPRRYDIVALRDSAHRLHAARDVHVAARHQHRRSTASC